MAKSVVSQPDRSNEVVKAAVTVGLIAGGVVAFVLFSHGRELVSFMVALAVVLAATFGGSVIGGVIGAVSSSLIKAEVPAEESSSAEQ